MNLVGMEIDGISRSFWLGRKEIKALSDITFSADSGKNLGLLGPNGAGKTTLLRILATLLKPDKGTAKINGWDIENDPIPVRKSIGYLSTRTGVYGRLTPVEIMEYFGSLHGLGRNEIRSRIEILFEGLDLMSYSNVKCETLSNGNIQKVSLARAMLHDPPVLILDEPTTGLDIIAAAATTGFIRKNAKDGKCVLFSTHILSEAERLCDRILILHEGILRASGSLDELRKQTGKHYLEDVFREVTGLGEEILD